MEKCDQMKKIIENNFQNHLNFPPNFDINFEVSNLKKNIRKKYKNKSEDFRNNLLVNGKIDEDGIKSILKLKGDKEFEERELFIKLI